MEGQELTQGVPASDNPLVRAILADKDGIVVSDRCRICKSPHRAKIEEMYEQKILMATIKKYLDDQGECHNPRQIKYHLETHYKSQMYNIAVAEYAENLERVLQRRHDAIQEAEAIKASCWIEITRHIGMTELSEEERNKYLCDKFDRIFAAINVIKSFEDSDAKAKAIEDRFEKIFTLAIENAQTEEEKKMIVLMLQKFKSTAPLTKGSS